MSDEPLIAVFVEGGGTTVSRFLRANALDRLQITVAPLILGTGRPGLSLPEITHPSDGLRPVTELFAAHGLSQQASAVLLGEQGDYAVRPSRTPVVMQAGLTDHYMRGAFYPEGGGQTLAAVRSNSSLSRTFLQRSKAAA